MEGDIVPHIALWTFTVSSVLGCGHLHSPSLITAATLSSALTYIILKQDFQLTAHVGANYYLNRDVCFLVMNLYLLYLQDPFPLHAIYGSLWKNTEGQLSFLKHAVLAPPEVFTFAHSGRQLVWCLSTFFLLPFQVNNPCFDNEKLFNILAELYWCFAWP